MFAAIASQYVISSLIPETGQLTLVDKLYGMGTFMIFMALVESAIAHHFYESGHPKLARWLDRFSLPLLLCGYLGFNAWLALS